VVGNTPRPIHRMARPTRAAALVCALMVVLPVQAATAPEASAAPEILLGRPRLGEFQPVRGDNFLAWQQNTRANPDQYDVYARPIEGGGRFKVNPASTNGANGDIDGDVLVYQQFKGSRRSQIRFFDLVGGDHDNPPAGVNTKQWEYWPSMSGRWLLFGRLYNSGVRRIILFDLTEGTARRLDQTRGANAFLAPGQVSGDYAVWHRCTRRSCNVTRYHIPDATKTQIPNPGGNQYSSSVTSAGTVYFARSSGGCGEGVRLMRRLLDGESEVVSRLQSGDDIGSTNTYVDGQGNTTVLFDQFDCARAWISDAWQMVEDTSPTLTVKVEGDASGTVTSSPAGISCGSDCTESYEVGTGVTLTATPASGATFAGWGGACTGTTTTCTLAMNGPRSVTATFTSKPVLTVSKSGNGQGTVTSSPSGISCGTDCNEPYTQGTSVTLTAAPNSATSTFGGWTGACSGMSLTCTVTMNGDRSVTATFILKPLLTVSRSGDGTGTVTSSPAGINCGGDCDQRYDPGTSVTLSAIADGDSTFTGWSGDCAGLTCTVTMDGNKSVTATFTLIPVVTGPTGPT
jgi:uncharacterized repeat protein (TIGR02543 family)